MDTAGRGRATAKRGEGQAGAAAPARAAPPAPASNANWLQLALATAPGSGAAGGRAAAGAGTPPGGAPLPAALRAEAEPLFGRGFGDVRVHADAAGDTVARAHGARALTFGTHIALRAGHYRPAAHAGRALLVHELAHVVQGHGQPAAALAAPLARAPATSAAEREARALARDYARGAERLRPAVRAPAGVLHADDGENVEMADEDETLPIAYPEVLKKNRYWWNRLGLAPITPFGSLNPWDYPVAYANETYRLQRFAHASGADQEIFGVPQDPDGVFGARTYVMLRRIAEAARDDPKVAEAVDKALIGHLLPSILAADAKAADEAWNRALADIFKAKFTVRWNVSVTNTALWDFWEQAFVLGDAMRARTDTLLFDGKPPEGTDDADRFAILRRLYGEEALPGVAALFEAERDFIHFFDIERLGETAKTPKGSTWNAYLGLAGPDVVDAALDQLGLEPPEGEKTDRLLAEIHASEADATGTKKPRKGGKPHIAALGLVYFLPKRSAAQIGEAVRAHFYQKQLGEAATEQAAAEWLAGFSEKIETRLKGKPDIEDYDTLLELLAGPAGAPVRDAGKAEALAARAEETLGLVLKIGSDATPTFLPWPNIRQLRQKGIENAKHMLRFGVFKPPKDSPLNLDKEGFTARRVDDSSVELARTVSQLTWDSEKGEGHGNVWADWKYFDKETYGNLEPVHLRLGELDPHTTFWVKRYRDVIGENEWIVQDLWLLGGNLPEVSKQLWEKVNAEAIIGLIDAALSLVAAGALVAGPLIALEAGAASAATAMTTGQIALTLTRAFLQRAFWFVVSEYLAQKFLDLDHSISTDKEKYTDSDREHWRYFKIGLLVLAGTLLLRQAWRGLKAGSSAALRASLAEIEKEMLKAELKTEGAAAGAAGRGLTQAELAVGKRANELVEAVGGAEAKAVAGEVAAETAVKGASVTDRIVAAGPTVAERVSAIAADAAGTPYLQYGGQPVRQFIAMLKGQLEQLAPAARGATGAELDLIDTQVRELEAALAGGTRQAADAAVQAEIGRLLTRLEGIAGKQGLASLDELTARSMLSFMFGSKNVPVQAELDKFVDEAWKLLKGKNRPTAVIDASIPKDTSGWFKAWVGKFGEIATSARAQTRGQLADTAYHEAMHARLRELFPFLREGATKNPALRTTFRHLDEIIAYAFGGVGRIRHGASVADKLIGVVEILGSPWIAYGSANNFLEAVPGIIRDAILFTLYIYALVRFAESRQPAPPSQPQGGTTAP